MQYTCTADAQLKTNHKPLHGQETHPHSEGNNALPISYLSYISHIYYAFIKLITCGP